MSASCSRSGHQGLRLLVASTHRQIPKHDGGGQIVPRPGVKTVLHTIVHLRLCVLNKPALTCNAAVSNEAMNQRGKPGLIKLFNLYGEDAE